MAQHQRFSHARSAAVLMAVLFTIPPSCDRTDVRSTASDRFSSDELRMLKEEESVGVETGYKEPNPPSSSEPYVMTEEDIRESGATNLPTLLRKILGLDDPEMTESDINRRPPVDRERMANGFLVVVDGHPIHIDPSDALAWKNIPVTLPDVHRLELWKASASAFHGFRGYDVVIKIITKTSGEVR